MTVLSESIMWEATIANDERYDGTFYYAVQTTGIVCRPSCKSKIPNRENVSFLTSLEEASQLGYRPCKRCRPDLGFQYDPETEAIKSACQILQSEYHNPEILEELPARIRFSTFHFQRLFKRITNHTPKRYLQQIRISKAAELLENSSMSNTDICLVIGFRSLSSFYAAFRQQKNISPKKYRKDIKEKGVE